MAPLPYDSDTLTLSIPLGEYEAPSILFLFGKKAIDVVGAVIGLLVIAPFVPFIAFAISFDSRGPVFVKIPRVSAGQFVGVYKFRSMIYNAPTLKPLLMPFNERNDGPFFKMRHDPRVTRVGRVLRKFRLDEFPQLWNVLRGELSLVGPRPYGPDEVSQYPYSYQHLILAKAGVTGLSQVNGSSSLSFLEVLEFDDYYVKNPSLLFDFKIIGKTIKIIFTDPTAV